MNNASMTILLPADLGYGIPWLVSILITAIVVTSAFMLYAILSTRSAHYIMSGRDSLKYKLHKYHMERYWAVIVVGSLAWLWFLGTTFSPVSSLQASGKVHVIDITARQWAWQLKDLGIQENNPSKDNAAIIGGMGMLQDQQASNANNPSATGLVKIKTGETVKFVARSLDVNHGFGVLQSSKSMDSLLLQMQVVPGYDNVFYYTFKEPGEYTIRCLEYCGWNHPFMTSQITIVAS